MGVVPLIRLGVFGWTTFVSLVVMAISAHLISQSQDYILLASSFCGLGVAVGVISLLTLPVMLVIDFIRVGAFTSMIVVELAWLSILWILWAATAGEAVSGYNVNFPYGCDFLNTVVNGMCQETQAIQALSFLNFIVILLYTAFLSTIAVITSNRGQSVWLSSVKESFGSLGGSAEYSMSQRPQPQGAHAQATAKPTQPGAGGVAV